MTTSDLELVEERISQLLAEHTVREGPEFWGAMYDLGLAWVHFPEGFGGLGLSPKHQATIARHLRSEGASLANYQRNILGIGMGGPVLAAHGTDEQKERWLRPMFTAEEIWCQMFSEPGAGSDVAGLATRAVRDGDEWITNGQKVWTTLAHVSKWGMLVARTDPDVPKHQGMSYFIVDMESDGVEVRPLYQITGEAEFNEVYFTDARIPDAYRLGEVGEGWRIALTTLMNERVAIGSNITPRGSGAIAEAMDVFRERGITDPTKRDKLARLWVAAEAMRLTNMRASDNRSKGTPGPAGSTGKLHWAELNKKITDFTMELLGADGLVLPGGYTMGRPSETGLGRQVPQRAFLRARANSIEGGTSEVMKNILGERVLGLPGEPRVDKEIAWRDVPRS
ncbi:MAG: acyl-CoA dehydrogenase family protein [Acidimicrobiia bacterium]|nr:acyl-CoA dehydrogenase family protein [Acidimicrobiia bacterium]